MSIANIGKSLADMYNSVNDKTAKRVSINSSSSIPRALAKAYLSNIDGSVIVDFQFAPSELNFSEGSEVKTFNEVGQHDTDLLWVSGKPQQFMLDIFVDRTAESFDNSDKQAFDEWYNIRRFISWYPSLIPILGAASPFGAGVAAVTTAGIAKSLEVYGMFKKKGQVADPSDYPSKYIANPEFMQTRGQGGERIIGVNDDVQKILYFIRPTGYTETSGEQSGDDIDKGRFTVEPTVQDAAFNPPPLCRFFYGNIWREGYIIDFNYNLSVPNNLLTPQRLMGQITIQILRGGVLDIIRPPQMLSEAEAKRRLGNNRSTAKLS